MPHKQTQAEWETEMSEKILVYIRHTLYLDLRYLEPALSVLAYEKKDGLLTFATDGVRLYYASEPLLRVFQTNDRFLARAYLHTVLHGIFRHLWLAGTRERRLWNLACDIAVEMVIDAMDKACTKRILSWLRIQTYEALKQEGNSASAAVVYRWLKEQEEERLPALSNEFYTDDHRFWPKESETDTPFMIQAKNNWEKAARQVSLEKNRTKEADKEGEMLLAAQMEAAKHRRSYQDFLRKFAVFREERQLNPEEFDLGYYSYGLRLYRNMPLIEPLETREIKKIREFVIVIDTSYSTNGKLVEGFLQETYDVLSRKNSFFRSCSIRLLQCDNQVRREDVIRCETDLKRLAGQMQLAGGGGTDFRPAFSYVERLRREGRMKKPGGLLYFTDGKGTYPKQKPDYKTAFLFLEEYEEEAVPPWAMRLRLEPEEWLHEYQRGKRRD